MPTSLRFLSITLGVAGLAGGVVLIAQAQPAESGGQMSALLAAYGVAAVVSGLFFGALGVELGWVEEDAEETPAPASKPPASETSTSETSVESTEEKPDLEDIEMSPGFFDLLLIALVFIALVIIGSASPL